MSDPIVVDCHSHVFNAEDLPVDGFIKRLSPLPSLLTGVFSVPLDLLTQWVAPGSGETELLLGLLGAGGGLETLAARAAAPATGTELISDAELDARLATLLPQPPAAATESLAVGAGAVGDVDAAVEGAIAAASPEQLAELTDWLASWGSPLPDAAAADGLELLSVPWSVRAAAVRAAAKRYLAVLRLATRHRHRIASELATTYPEVSLFVPALVDFTHTARDHPATDVPAQITVHSLVAKLSITGGIPEAPDTRFHPIVGYCPYREIATSELRDWDPVQDEDCPYIPYADPLAAAEQDRSGPGLRYDPARARPLRPPVGEGPAARLDLGGVERSLDLVRHAVELGGFVGVKLYPPAGYLPLDNVTRFGERVGGRLDAALRALYSYCEVEQVPILTHAAASNGFEPGYDDLAAPTGWAAVLTAFPDLRLCFGHFGHLHGVGDDGTPAEGSWPSRFMRLIDRYPHVYADVGNAHFISSEEQIVRYRQLLVSLLGPRETSEPVFLARRRRVMFGTDFWMNLTGPDYAGYLQAFHQEIGATLGERARQDFMGANALRWLGFTGQDDEPDEANRNRRRLLAFYGTQPPPSWLA